MTAVADADSTDTESPMRYRHVWALPVVLAAVVRLAALATPVSRLDADEAATGLMARDIAHGHWYVFFAGQNYMGALEQYLQAPLVTLAPGSPYVLRLPEVGLGVAAVALIDVVGRLLFRRRSTALVAATAYAAGPAFTVLGSFRSLGAYGASTVVGLLGLLCALTLSRSRGTGRALLFGACCGLGLWLTPMSAFLLVPAALWAAGTWRAAERRGRLAGAAAAGAVLGAAPLLAWIAVYGQVPVVTLHGDFPGPASRLWGLVTAALPEAIGLAWQGGASPLPRTVLTAASLLLAGVWARVAWGRRARLGRLLRLRGDRDPVDLICVAVPLAVVLYVASRFTWWTVEPRYLQSAMPWAAWAFAAGLAGRTVRVRATAVALVAACSWSTLAYGAATTASTWTRDLRTTAGWMRAHGVQNGYADYRAAHTLTFVAGGGGDGVVVVPFGKSACRFPDQTARVDAAPHVAYVASDTYTHIVASAVRKSGARVEATLTTPTITAYVLAAPAPRPWQIGLASEPPECSHGLSMPAGVTSGSAARRPLEPGRGG